MPFNLLIKHTSYWGNTFVFSYKKKKYFGKKLAKNYYKKEVNGYLTLKKYYPVPKLIYKDSVDNILIFEYVSNVDKGGLLVDLFANKNYIDKGFLSIINLYKKVFIKTLKRNTGLSSNVFFKDRIESRLNKFYGKKFFELFKGKKVMLNGKEIILNPKKIIEDVRIFFIKKPKSKWCVISQCDPNDLNIASGPVIFDYLAGGYNPLMAEYATLFWYNLCQGNYLSLKYNKESFTGHEKIFKRKDRVIVKKNEIHHYIADIRMEFLKKYTEDVIDPCFDKILQYPEWYDDFKNHMAMKILAVFNVAKMEYKDTLLSLAYLEYFYNYINPSNPGDLISQTLKLCKR